MMKREKNLHFLGMAVMIAVSMPASWLAVRAAEIPAAPAEDDMAFRLAGVTVEAKRPDWESKLSPGTVTVIRPEEFKGEQKDLADFLKMVPGVHVREVNGKGQYTVVTVRGSTAAQVGVFVDGILTNLGGDAAVDISTIPVKNVERIEVYRGYIPARFGGTFIGGVVNIVTKRPAKADISAEIGKSSFGGKSASLEVMSPLGNGSLMVGLNHETAKGDFPYKNYVMNSKESKKEAKYAMLSYETELGWYEKSGDKKTWLMRTLRNYSTHLSDETRNKYKAGNVEDWMAFASSGALAEEIYQYHMDQARQKLDWTWKNEYAELVPQEAAKDYFYTHEATGNFKELWDRYERKLKKYIQAGNTNGIERIQQRKKELVIRYLQRSWDNKNSYFYEPGNADVKAAVDGTIESKNSVILDEADRLAKYNAQWLSQGKYVDPEQSEEYTKIVERHKYVKKRVEKLKSMSENRHRRWNDRKNTSAIVKWQNDEWMVKGSWNRIKRHLPDSLWAGYSNTTLNASLGYTVDWIDDAFYAEGKRQRLYTNELMVENRHHNGRLEWGWTADFQKQKKYYDVEHMYHLNENQVYWENVPFRKWSRFISRKYNFLLDGTYQLGNRQLLEFQTNYSHERMHVNGSLMDKVLGDSDYSTLLGAIRNRYDQNIWNIQIQDTITLDKKGTWFLTPAWRYNRSVIVGYSDGKRFADTAWRWFHWITPRDRQQDGKGTWQLALKKQVNDNLTLRMTGGTYFRLLNMYEIAGDGAGILPVPANKRGTASKFPQPEYGTQFDFSTLWNGKFLHSDAYATLTYFWRHANRMLYLYRAGPDWASYFNDQKGHIHGFELQTGLKWGHFSLDLEGAYTKIKAFRRQNKEWALGDAVYREVYPTFQPEWEGNLRFSWFPNPRFTLFGEWHYTSSYYTINEYRYNKLGDETDDGVPYPSLSVINAGVKVKPGKAWQIAFGCNDIFNRASKQKGWVCLGTNSYGYLNVEYPIQGRTWYGTVRYEF